LGISTAGLPHPLVYLALVPLIFLAMALHEVGHVIGGLIAGFRFISLVAGPLRVIATARGMRVGLNRNLDLAGGMAATLPKDVRNLQPRLMVAVGGGPLSSLLLGLAAGGLAIRLLPEAPDLGALAGMAGLAALAIFLATISPHETGGAQSDGAQLLALLRGGPQMELYKLILEIQAASLQGGRPRDWPIARLAQAMANSEQRDDDWAQAGLLAYYHALDSGETSAAGRLLEQLSDNFEGYSPGMRHSLALEVAFYQARYCQDPSRGHDWLRRGRDGLFGAHTRLRAEAALLLAEEQPGPAAQKAREGLRAAKGFFDRGLAVAETEWMRAILLQAEQVSVESGKIQSKRAGQPFPRRGN
jgi:hypothetical protein